MVNALPSTPESTPCPIAEALTPPSCLNTIYGLSDSLLLSVSASRINIASPEVPDEICTVPCGLLVPNPNLPSEVIRNLSVGLVSPAVVVKNARSVSAEELDIRNDLISDLAEVVGPPVINCSLEYVLGDVALL